MNFDKILTDNGWKLNKVCGGCSGRPQEWTNANKQGTMVKIYPNTQQPYFYVFVNGHCIKAKYFNELEKTITEL